MKAYQIQTSEGIDGLKLVDLPDPKPGVGQILVRVRATSLNYRDTAVVSGRYPGQNLPVIPLSDGAGEVVEVGIGVTRVKVGDRVAGIFFQDWIAGKLTRQKIKSALGGAIDGMLAEYVVLNQDGVVHLPEHLSYKEGVFPRTINHLTY
jgi:NADPH:quinone reductase-like Zn-dependent oxidoreductase